MPVLITYAFHPPTPLILSSRPWKAPIDGRNSDKNRLKQVGILQQPPHQGSNRRLISGVNELLGSERISWIATKVEESGEISPVI